MKNKQTHVVREHEQKLFAEVKALLEADVRKHCSNKELASKTGLNRTKLSYGFKQLFGYSIYQYTIQLRISLAKNLLITGELQIKVIAKQCGYKTLQHFVTAFKKYAGVTPGEFQKKHFRDNE